MTKIIPAAFAAAALAALIPAAAQADGPQAIATAATHAGLAANGANINVVHTHLHHVLNCLVGPGGEGFDAAPGNPCGGSGSAIPQTSDAAMKTKLEMVAAQVRTGIASEDMDAAKKVAMDAQAALK